ncbi:MAG: M23 family metallopeptidase, partial [Sphingomonadaceae bacterium]|nr:M23 family metallopeptidase [Sphingomonadaceae bacterium]
AIREFGLDPQALGRRAMGGPYIPAARDRGGANESIDEQIEDLENALNRLAAMEISLRAIPSASPTTRLALTSAFGYRSDPFNGDRAMHSGLDISGSHGQGILATAGGRIVKAGWANGYGNMIEIDHGAGMITRYAHLSGVDVRVGQRVARGQRIGRMGSTGRSTSTHLHYEIRINGQAINPRRFLEANPDVLEIQSLASRRNVDSNRRG